MGYTHPIVNAWQKFLDAEAAAFDFDCRDMNFSVRVQNVLDRYPITSLAQLCSLSRRDLLKSKNFGPRSLREIEAELARRGLSLRQS